MKLLQTDAERMQKFAVAVEAFDELCERGQYTDTETAWNLLNEARALVRDHMTQPPIFEVLTVAREDIENQGYDAGSLSDDDMEKFADQLGESLMESGDYWSVIDTLAEDRKLAEFKSACPNCGSVQAANDIDYLGDQKYQCPNCKPKK